MADSVERDLQFGPFELSSRERVLRREGRVLSLGDRAFDILIFLAAHAGEVISKQELIHHVWPGVTVEKGTLRVHVAAIRKALGDGQSGNRYIANIKGRGYSFVGTVVPLKANTENANDKYRRQGRLPVRSPTMIGRERVVGEVGGRLRDERFVTLLGPGGIGKTTIAVAVGHVLAEEFDGEVYFVDFGSITDPGHVVRSVGTSLGLVLKSNDTSAELVDVIRSRRLLIILDCCEHVIEAVALVAEQLFMGGDQVHLLATSRELLRVEGEHCYRVLPLDSPPADSVQTADDVLRYPAVQLFVERVTARGGNFVLTDSEAPFIADMCRRLDGLPLAIELAAGPAAALGVKSTVVRLVSRLELLKLGHRTAVPRHQTLRATLDWSYDLLSNVERIVFRRIARFVGDFCLEGAIYVAGEQSSVDAEIFDAIAGLVEKSLLCAEVGQEEPEYRLLDTTRAYALEKLEQHAEFDAISLRLTEYVTGYLESQADGLSGQSGIEGIAACCRRLGNVRSALEWSFGPHGNDDIATRLAAASAQLFVQLSLLMGCQGWVEEAIAPREDHRKISYSLLDEYIGWAERAIAVSSRAVNPNKRQQLELVAALAEALIHSWGPDSREVAEALERTLALSNELGHAFHRARAFWGLCWHRIASGDYLGALALAEEFLNRYGDSGSDASVLAIKRMKASALKLLGNFRSAQPLLEEIAAQPVHTYRRSIESLFSFDSRVSATAIKAGNLWFQGFAARAIQVAQESLEESLSVDHVPSLCASLALSACPISIYAGDIEAASKYIQLLLERSQAYRLEFWNLYARSYALVMAHREGAAVSLSDAPYLRMETSRAGLLREQIATHCPSICDPRLFSEAERQSGWCRPELLRVKGELLRASPDMAAQQAAESAFLLSLKLAREHGALFWEVRTAVSLAEFWKPNRRRDARDVIEDALGRFIDPYQTPDIRTGRRLYQELR